tara:strand:- start:1771 stop:2328 length:558 start_codon:yes stop_codon:yes gene_type:complete
MSDSWYLQVPAETPLTQGDLIDSCPVVEWKPVAVKGELTDLRAATHAVAADVIVMTQACDLEHGKVQNVLLCPRDRLSVYKKQWEEYQLSKKQPTNTNSWRKHCKNIRDGYVWNVGLLDASPDGEPAVIDFHEVYTVPRVFLDSFLIHQKEPRLRLESPYREHLSQAFARFFMRVGLPTPVRDAW